MTAEPGETDRPDSAPRRVLVTGGSGFIGSHLVERLVARGDDVTIVDDLSTGSRANLHAIDGRVSFIEGRVSAALSDLAGGAPFDEIYHLAASVGVKLVVDAPVETIENNVLETAALLRFACGQGAGGARTLIASSSEVYGKSTKTPFSEDDDVVYGPTTRWRWSYAATKALDEYLALGRHERDGLPVVVARFFNTVGPRQIGSYGMVLPSFVASALRNEDVRVYGDGEQSRCFCDVRDVADALPRMVASRECAGRVFNIGSDQTIRIIELARRVIEVTGSRSEVRLVPYDEAYGRGFEDLRVRQPDVSRLRSAIGFAPARSLDETIRDIAAWIQHEGPRR